MTKYKLGEICEIVSGSTPKTGIAEYWGGELKWITPAEISEDSYIITDSVRKLTELGIKKTGLTPLPKGTVILSSRAPIGKVAIAGCEMYCNQGFKNLICTKKINNRYLYWFLKGNTAYLNSLGRGATFKEISKQIVSGIEINVPDMNQQMQAVENLEKVWRIIQLRKQELQKGDELIKARFVEMFDSIKDICEVGYYIKSLTAGKSLAGEAECENKVLKTGAASFDFFDATQVKNLPVDYEPKEEHLVNVGDIIISRMNTAELTGAAAYVWDVPGKVYLPDRLWKAVLDDNSNPIFVWQMLIQPSTKEQIQRECSGTSGSMKNISKAGMLGIKVKKVPLEMQDQFADFVKQVDKSKFTKQIDSPIS